MAIRTKALGVLVEPEGRAELQVDWDDAAPRLTLVRIVNTHPTLTARVTATSVANPARAASLDGPPNQTTTRTLPTGQQQRLDITIDARGRLHGVEYQFGWLPA